MRTVPKTFRALPNDFAPLPAFGFVARILQEGNEDERQTLIFLSDGWRTDYARQLASRFDEQEASRSAFETFRTPALAYISAQHPHTNGNTALQAGILTAAIAHAGTHDPLGLLRMVGAPPLASSASVPWSDSFTWADIEQRMKSDPYTWVALPVIVLMTTAYLLNDDPFTHRRSLESVVRAAVGGVVVGAMIWGVSRLLRR